MEIKILSEKVFLQQLLCHIIDYVVSFSNFFVVKFVKATNQKLMPQIADSTQQFTHKNNIILKTSNLLAIQNDQM